MKITKKGEYALKALLNLASVYGRQILSIREISDQENLPPKFLEQIMMILKRSDIVRSVKGKMGGYCLSRPPAQITLGEIIRTLEGSLSPLGTVEDLTARIQKDERHAGLYIALLDVRNAIAKILDHSTLADILDRSRELALSRPLYQMYYI